MSLLTVTPAYGRDYKSSKAARADWDAGKDWIIADISNPYDGKPINKTQADDAGEIVQLRFHNRSRVIPARDHTKKEG